ncbi:MAG TPA: argininosuccinate lyase [Alphaproteobacteria bacterium]|nr:argininosuccinate lyase [Alphaproteobacteria bacterium]
MSQSPSEEAFPAAVYKDTVLEPLFESAKRHYWRHLMRVNRASAVMLAQQAVLTAAEVRAILGALAEIERLTDVTKLAYTGKHEDLFFVVEAALIDRLGVAVAGKLHTGRSRNDIDHTVFKLALKERIAGIVEELLGLVAALLDAAERERATLIVAYTHGQPAQPTTWGHYLGAFIELLLRDFDRVKESARASDLSSMGAAAITTSGFPLDRKLMADLLGFADVQENSYGCIAAADYATALYAQLRLVFLHLGRFVQDLAFRASFEVGHLHVPDAYVQISSIMPQKRNPVPIEHLRLLCSLAAQRAECVVVALHNTPFTDINDAEGEVQAAGYEAFETGARALRLLAGLIAAVRIDEVRVRRHIDESFITMTELADSLVRRERLSFRQAHDVASRLSRALLASGERVSTASYDRFVEAFAAIAGRAPQLNDAGFREALTPEHFIAVRTLPGGPAPAPLAASLARYRRDLEAARSWLGAWSARLAAGDALLAARAAAILGR